MRETSPNWFTPSHLHPMPDQCLQTLNRAVVVAQLAEQSFSIPEVCSLNWGIHKKINWTLLTVEKTKIKKKEAGNGLIVYLFDIDGLHLRVLPQWRLQWTLWWPWTLWSVPNLRNGLAHSETCLLCQNHWFSGSRHRLQHWERSVIWRRAAAVSGIKLSVELTSLHGYLN